MPHIKNAKQLARSSERSMVLAMIEAALDAVDTTAALSRALSLEGSRLTTEAGVSVDLSEKENVYVVAIGKCAFESARALSKILGVTMSRGIAIGVGASGSAPERMTFCEGTHPYPSEGNIHFTQLVLDLLEKTTERDLVIFAISGGGSTLLCNPQSHTCVQEEQIVSALFRRGATITQINTIRKHISKARGGNLAKAAYPAEVLSCIFSDVPGDDIEYIASGPTVRDSTTRAHALSLLAQFDLFDSSKVRPADVLETPKEAKYFERVHNHIVVSNTLALEAMSRYASEKGYQTEICTNCLTGEASVVGKNIVAALRDKEEKTVLLYGGETTVTIKGKGVGGRNQELVLSALEDVREGELVCAIASDGCDNSSHAGAIGDTLTKGEAEEKHLRVRDYLKSNDSHTFFAQVGDYIDTGYTGSNVSDLVIAVRSS